MSTLIINTDGGARGNPGPAAIGVVMQIGKWQFLHQRTIGETTNNVAEYTAVLDALDNLPADQPYSTIIFNLDSELVVKQINKEYKVKEPTLQNLCSTVLAKLNNLTVPYRFVHVPRAQNKQADKLVNQALDAIQ